jgi:hypothetical protein
LLLSVSSYSDNHRPPLLLLLLLLVVVVVVLLVLTVSYSDYLLASACVGRSLKLAVPSMTGSVWKIHRMWVSRDTPDERDEQLQELLQCLRTIPADEALELVMRNATATELCVVGEALLRLVTSPVHLRIAGGAFFHSATNATVMDDLCRFAQGGYLQYLELYSGFSPDVCYVMSARLIRSYGLGCSSEQSNVRFAGLQLPFYHRAYGTLPTLPFVHSGTTLTLSLGHFEPLREALAACLPVLKNLCLVSFPELTKADVETFQEWIRSTRTDVSVHVFVLGLGRLSRRLIDAIAPGFDSAAQNLPRANLESVTVEYLKANDAGKLEPLLTRWSTIRRLDLRFGVLKFGGARKLVQAMEKNQSLVYLNMSRNRIRGNLSKLLAGPAETVGHPLWFGRLFRTNGSSTFTGIPFNASLQELNLSDNALQLEGFSWTLLVQHPSLSLVNLSGNLSAKSDIWRVVFDQFSLHDQRTGLSFCYLADVEVKTWIVGVNLVPRELKVRLPGFFENTTSTLWEILDSDHCSLRELHLDQRHLPNEELSKILECAVNQSALTELHVQVVDRTAVDCLLPFLERAIHLRTVFLTIPGFDHEWPSPWQLWLPALLQVLQKNISLTCFHVIDQGGLCLGEQDEYRAEFGNGTPVRFRLGTTGSYYLLRNRILRASPPLVLLPRMMVHPGFDEAWAPGKHRLNSIFLAMQVYASQS